MVRTARLPADEAAILSFIRALQEHEAAFEPNRRLDPAFAPEHWAAMKARARHKDGIILIAEQDGRPLGWALAHDEPGEVYMAMADRRHGFLAEIYVVPEARAKGHGRALIAACEAWARGRGHSTLMIGVLAANAGAIRRYRAAGYAPYGLTMRRYL